MTTVKTLQECKDTVAKEFHYSKYAAMRFHAHPGEFDRMVEPIANLYASQFKDYLQAIKDQVDQHGKISIVKGDITYTAIENILK